MGSHGKALAVSFFRRRARLRSRANDFHYSIEKRCGQLARFVSFNEIHVIYKGNIFLQKSLRKSFAVLFEKSDTKCIMAVVSIVYFDGVCMLYMVRLELLKKYFRK